MKKWTKATVEFTHSDKLARTLPINNSAQILIVDGFMFVKTDNGHVYRSGRVLSNERIKKTRRIWTQEGHIAILHVLAFEGRIAAMKAH